MRYSNFLIINLKQEKLDASIDNSDEESEVEIAQFMAIKGRLYWRQYDPDQQTSTLLAELDLEQGIFINPKTCLGSGNEDMRIVNGKF